MLMTYTQSFPLLSGEDMELSAPDVQVFRMRPVEMFRRSTPSFTSLRVMLTVFFFSVVVLFVSAEKPRAAAVVGSAPSSIYKLHSGDSISVSYRITPEYNQNLTILPDGNIDLRLIGQVHLDGLSVEEARQAITALANQRLRDPEVSVSVTDFVRDQFTVMGEVGKPGRYEMHGSMTIVDALALANGFTQLSAQRHVVLVRPLDAHSEYGNATAFDFKHLLDVHRTTVVPVLENGDIIIVTTSKFAKLTGTIRLLNVGLYYNPASGL